MILNHESVTDLRISRWITKDALEEKQRIFVRLIDRLSIDWTRFWASQGAEAGSEQSTWDLIASTDESVSWWVIRSDRIGIELWNRAQSNRVRPRPPNHLFISSSSTALATWLATTYTCQVTHLHTWAVLNWKSKWTLKLACGFVVIVLVSELIIICSIDQTRDRRPLTRQRGKADHGWVLYSHVSDRECSHVLYFKLCCQKCLFSMYLLLVSFERAFDDVVGISLSLLQCVSWNRFIGFINGWWFISVQ